MASQVSCSQMLLKSTEGSKTGAEYDIGPLLIHGPTSANWDIAWEPIFMNDWVHANAFSLFTRELVGPLPTTDSVLLGGQGK